MSDRLAAVLARTFVCLVVLSFAALIAVGCGGGDDEEGIAGSGGLAFVPADAVGVGMLSLREEDLDATLKTLDRLPAWSLVETQLPSSSADKLFELGTNEMLKGSKDTKGLTYKQDVKPWLGETAGVALLGGAVDDPKSLDGDNPPIFLWVDSTDEDKAADFAKEALGKVKTSEHDGVELIQSTKEDGVIFVKDGAMVITPSVKIAKQVIDDADGDDFADEKYVEEMLDTDDRDEQFVGVASTERLLQMAEGAAKDSDDEDAQKAAKLLGDDAIRDLLPDAIGFSGGIDKAGIWFDSTWAPAGKPAIDDAREMAGKLPAASISVQAQGSKSEFVEQIPEVWASVKDTYDLDIADLTKECDPEEKPLCDVVAGLATGVLEGDLIERATEVSGDDGAVAMSQSVSTEGGFAQGYGVITRVTDVGDSNELTTDGVEALTPALKPYGVDVTFTETGDDGVLALKVPPKGKAGMMLAAAQKEMAAESVDTDAVSEALDSTAQYEAIFGQLASPEGLTLDIKALDDRHQAMSFPNDDLEDLVSAWEGDADQIADEKDYQRDLKAAGVPDKTSSFSWINYPALFEQLGESADGGSDPTFTMIANNIDKIGGMVIWTERRGEGDKVGVARVVVPIHE